MLQEEEIGSNLFALTRKVPLALPDGSTGLVGIILASVTPNVHLKDAETTYDTLSLASGDHLRQLNESLSKRARELESCLTLAELKQQATLEIAHTDVTTGLKNRLGFEAELAAAIHGAEATGKRFGVAFIDVDRFKQINDRYGHATGDLVLSTVGKRLSELPDIFAVARWGGDEFALLTELPNIGQAALLEGFEDAHRYTFRPVKGDHRRINISGSVGISVYPQDATCSDDLMRYADMALMVAKRQGRGRVLPFDAHINDAMSRRLQIIRDLPDADPPPPPPAPLPPCATARPDTAMAPASAAVRARAFSFSIAFVSCLEDAVCAPARPACALPSLRTLALIADTVLTDQA
ncbi:MAG: hypothetical protein VR74_12405 [Hyphomonas sp. BRH_c22]|uniref:GGDEF domain-containing protein n=1 Tax=Hyphomonas sp. BRH_c22 TaxID=1629710 RepID=UPI0005F1C3ED|nr:GGDEF domain-containing protein [Hyphomonas sp. BRH_c22]KJS36631.1 MAG: hypothetical protein VR74_12405 [Hyphomonas sp. BRH_c22]